MSAAQALCTHGLEGGCDLLCTTCGHGCRRHQAPDGRCEAGGGEGDPGPAECACPSFDDPGG